MYGILERAVNNNILVFDSEAEDGKITTRLFKIMLETMSNNAYVLTDGILNDGDKVKLTHIYTSSKNKFDLKSIVSRVYADPVSIHPYSIKIEERYKRFGAMFYHNKKNIVLFRGLHGILMLGCY